MPWVYMIKNKGNKIYVGITNSPSKRITNHNRRGGAKFTKNNPSFEIVFLEEYLDLKNARRREVQIKKWRRDKKEKLIERYSLGLDTKPLSSSS